MPSCCSCDSLAAGGWLPVSARRPARCACSGPPAARSCSASCRRRNPAFPSPRRPHLTAFEIKGPDDHVIGEGRVPDPLVLPVEHPLGAVAARWLTDFSMNSLTRSRSALPASSSSVERVESCPRARVVLRLDAARRMIFPSPRSTALSVNQQGRQTEACSGSLYSCCGRDGSPGWNRWPVRSRSWRQGVGEVCGGSVGSAAVEAEKALWLDDFEFHHFRPLSVSTRSTLRSPGERAPRPRRRWPRSVARWWCRGGGLGRGGQDEQVPLCGRSVRAPGTGSPKSWTAPPLGPGQELVPAADVGPGGLRMTTRMRRSTRRSERSTPRSPPRYPNP
jgi:hypothetical protein